MCQVWKLGTSLVFAAIVTTRNGTESTNFRIRNTVITSIKTSGNRLVHIIGLDSSRMLTKPCHQSSSSFPNIKHATSTAGDAIDEMGGGVRGGGVRGGGHRKGSV